MNIIGTLNRTVYLGNRVKLWGIRHKNDILFYTGLTAMSAGAIGACVASTKVKDVTERNKKKLERLLKKKEEGKLDPKEAITTTGQIGWSYGKLYGLSLLTYGVGMGLCCRSHLNLKNEVMVATARAASTGALLAAYRKRIKEKFGQEGDDIGMGVKNVEKTVTEVDEKTGEVKEKKVTVKDYSEANMSIYNAIFNKQCRGFERDRALSINYMQGLEKYYTAVLRSKGFLWMSDILEELKIDCTRLQRDVGWLYDHEDPNKYGDSYVDFGISRDIDALNQFLRGETDELMLNFNCYGDIRHDFERMRAWS